MKIQETVRDDGMRIISGKFRSKKVELCLISTAGSAYDPPEKQGLFHYFEHMAFKGTEKMTMRDIQALSARYLLSKNAGTGRLATSYYGTAVQRKFSELCEFLCDIYFHSTYPEGEIEKEKEVVLNEIATSKEKDSDRADYALWEMLWRENPLRVYGAGTPEGIARITRADVLDAHAAWHVPSATIAIAAGAVDHDTLVEKLNTLIPKHTQEIFHKTWDSENAEPPREQKIVIALPKREKATIVCGCKLPLSTDERTAVLEAFLNYLLVRGTTSVLWDEIREKRGLAYSVSGGIRGEYPLGSYFFAYASVFPSRIEETCDLMYRFIGEPLSNSAVFEATKEWLYDWYTLDFQEPQDWAGLILHQLNRGWSLKQCERYFSRIRKLISSVTLDEVEAYRVTMLKRENFATVIVKPE